MDNWEKLTSGVYSKTFGKFNNLLQTVTAAFTREYLIREADRLFIQKQDPEFHIPELADVSVMKGLETARQLLAWRDKYGQDVAKWLETDASGKKQLTKLWFSQEN
jgi:hypothetical protein